jgi:atypical dual specificity phosphatase
VSDWFERFGRSEVAEGLLVGAFPLDAEDVAALSHEGVTRVVNLCEDGEYEPGERDQLAQLYRQAGIAEQRVPCTDHGNILPGALEQGSKIVLGHLSAGERVYLHCRAGWQRSAAMAAAALARRDEIGVDAALGLVKSAKPSADPLPHQIEDLRRWSELREPPSDPE